MSANPVILSASLVRTFLKIDLIYSFTIGSAKPSSEEIEVTLSPGLHATGLQLLPRKGTRVGIGQLDDAFCHPVPDKGCKLSDVNFPPSKVPRLKHRQARSFTLASGKFRWAGCALAHTHRRSVSEQPEGIARVAETQRVL